MTKTQANTKTTRVLVIRLWLIPNTEKFPLTQTPSTDIATLSLRVTSSGVLFYHFCHFFVAIRVKSR